MAKLDHVYAVWPDDGVIQQGVLNPNGGVMAHCFHPEWEHGEFDGHCTIKRRGRIEAKVEEYPSGPQLIFLFTPEETPAT